MLLNKVRFPFSAVAGQAQFKRALILAAINPRLGGVLISGPRGSAKSTLARGMADLLPGDEHPFVTLPLGATEEMLVGTLDLQQALADRSVAFHPGLLARAHNGVLYVDEVNLLPDNLVDVLLDVAASGINCVERDGISHQHEAAFILIGTMNPDEGELRPQLQDRFGLMVTLSNEYAVKDRVDIVQRREQFDRDPHGFVQAYAQQQQQLVERIQQARAFLDKVVCEESLRVEIAERCHAAAVEGMRADIVWYRSASAHAAWCGRDRVRLSDLDAVQALVLDHRCAPSPEEPPPSSPPSRSRSSTGSSPFSRPMSQDSSASSTADGDWGSMPPQQQRAASEPAIIDVAALWSNTPSTHRLSSLNLACAIPASGHQFGDGKGRRRSRRSQASKRPDWFKTFSVSARQTEAWPPQVQWQPLKTGHQTLNVVLLDASASLISQQAFSRSKALVLALARQAYLKRERLTLWQFGNQQVSCVLPCVRAPKQVSSWLDTLPAGGGTPIRQGLLAVQAYLQRMQRQQPDWQLRTCVLTDGRSRQPIQDILLPGVISLVDMETSTVRRGRGQAMARELKAHYVPVSNVFVS